MIEYKGTYRVYCDRDIKGEPLDELTYYLVGTGSHRTTKVYKYDDNYLTVYVDSVGRINNLYKALLHDDCKNVNLEVLDGEGMITIHNKYISVLAKHIKMKTSGAGIAPTSIRNHPNYSNIKAERNANLTDEQKEANRLRGIALRERLNNKAES